VWRRAQPSPASPELEEMVTLLHGMATMLMEIDAKLERIVSILEEDE
jgi:hypothetical protein